VLKLRRADFKIKYQGEKGQDEGGLKREWYTNLMKDILESDRFKSTA
jgi:E3 ubiquitin-protein ligase HUWE1